MEHACFNAENTAALPECADWIGCMYVCMHACMYACMYACMHSASTRAVLEGSQLAAAPEMPSALPALTALSGAANQSKRPSPSKGEDNQSII